VIAEAAAALHAGRVVVFPTETVYGLGARALDPRAVQRVFEVKGRPRSHPLIVHVRSEAEAQTYAAEWPPLARALARAFWPGPLTLVVSKADFVPGEITGGSPAVALRVPAHPVALALLAAVGEALVAPSANRYQSISPTRAEHVVQSLEGHDLLVLDAGPCPSGIESTVVDVRDGEARVLRPGALSLQALRAVAPSVQFARTTVPGDAASRVSPGLGQRHYAPTTPLEVATDRASALARAFALASSGERVGLVLFRDPVRSGNGDPNIAAHVLPGEPASAGAALYALLHELDRQKYAHIIVEPPPAEPGWEAITDRLRRAAH
jgi:L-threonylcarbamoyladenylate synthase